MGHLVESYSDVETTQVLYRGQHVSNVAVFATFLRPGLWHHLQLYVFVSFALSCISIRIGDTVSCQTNSENHFLNSPNQSS